jgi:hypothetical protein
MIMIIIITIITIKGYIIGHSLRRKRRRTRWRKTLPRCRYIPPPIASLAAASLSFPVIGCHLVVLSYDWLIPTHALLWLADTKPSSPVTVWHRTILSCDWLVLLCPLLWLAATKLSSPVTGGCCFIFSCDWLTPNHPLLWLADAGWWAAGTQCGADRSPRKQPGALFSCSAFIHQRKKIVTESLLNRTASISVWPRSTISNWFLVLLVCSCSLCCLLCCVFVCCRFDVLCCSFVALCVVWYSCCCVVLRCVLCGIVLVVLCCIASWCDQLRRVLLCPFVSWCILSCCVLLCTLLRRSFVQIGYRRTFVVMYVLSRRSVARVKAGLVVCTLLPRAGGVCESGVGFRGE